MIYDNPIFAAEIRDTNEHESSTAENESGITVTANTLHPESMHDVAVANIYIKNNHDQSLDVSVEHAGQSQGFDGAATAATRSLAADGTTGNVRVEGPIGQLQLTFAAATAPTAGDVTVDIEASA